MTSRPTSWMPLYIADYDQATSRLSLEADAAYMRLIRDYWLNGPPPDDDPTLARIIRIDRRHWIKLRPQVAPFFAIVDGLWKHKRIDEELQRAESIIEKRRMAGLQGGRPRREPENTSKAHAYPAEKHQETPARVASPSPLPSEVPSGAKAPLCSLVADLFDDFPPNAFDVWYARYPNKVSKKEGAEAFKRLRVQRRCSFAELMEGLERYIRNKPPDRSWLNPATFLNKDRWDDAPALPALQLVGSDGTAQPSTKLIARHDNYARSLAGAKIAADAGGFD